MQQLRDDLENICALSPIRFALSSPRDKQGGLRRAQISQKGEAWQVERFTDTQSFHNNVKWQELVQHLADLLEKDFFQLTAFTEKQQISLRVTTKGKVLQSTKAVQQKMQLATNAHNRQKNYILPEGKPIAPLVDLGVFTQEGRVVASMQNKYRQINRFLELIDDVFKEKPQDEINILDFGCGKSYLTFIVYYYFTELKGYNVNITGLDLKADVVKTCNATAKKYGYSGLCFEVGDINGYKYDKPVEMLMTLHACDTATDYALAGAVNWGAKIIFSVPCCQHELNSQIKSEEFSILTHYGIVKERVSALFTDAIRANLLKACGYKTQLLEFIDFSHTPKNILIRAVKRNIPEKERQKAVAEVENLVNEFHLDPALLRLLKQNGDM